MKTLKKERERLKKKLQLVDAMIEEYSNIDPDLQFEHFLRLDSKVGKVDYDSPLQFEDEFPKGATWLKQILHLLDKHKRFLGNTEMAELLLPYYPDKNVDSLKRRVSVVISDAFKNDKVRGLIKLKVSSLPQGYVWGYKKWLDSKMEIRQGHQPFRYEKSPKIWG
ncbi:MAG: hypothetical protein RIM83_15900 [Allomuricauda sp.]